MAYTKCNACPDSGQCKESEMCLNTLVTARLHPCPEAAPAGPQSEAVVIRAPVSITRTAGVADKINAACEAQLRLIGGELNEVVLRAAASAALPLLLADGVNANSARKGVGVWVRARKSAA